MKGQSKFHMQEAQKFGTSIDGYVSGGLVDDDPSIKQYSVRNYMKKHSNGFVPPLMAGSGMATQDSAMSFVDMKSVAMHSE